MISVKTPKPATIEETSTPHVARITDKAIKTAMYLINDLIKEPTVLAHFPLRVQSLTMKLRI